MLVYVFGIFYDQGRMMELFLKMLRNAGVREHARLLLLAKLYDVFERKRPYLANEPLATALYDDGVEFIDDMEQSYKKVKIAANQRGLQLQCGHCGSKYCPASSMQQLMPNAALIFKYIKSLKN